MSDDSNTRYNQVRQKGSHNSYERKEGLDDQELTWRLRAIELDIHNGKDCSHRPPLDGDWYVYHYCTPATLANQLAIGSGASGSFFAGIRM